MASIRLRAKYPILAKDDLRVFSRCADEVFKRPLFSEGAVTTMVVHVAVLAGDLLKQQGMLRALAEAKQDEHVDKQLREAWDAFGTLLDRADKTVGQLFRRISRRYDEYVKVGGFEEEHGGDDKNNREMVDAAKRRRGSAT